MRQKSKPSREPVEKVVRYIRRATRQQKLAEGKIEVAIMRRMPDWILHLWGGRVKEDEFIAFAEQAGARRIQEIGPYRPLPDHVFVYDFRGAAARGRGLQ